MHEETVLMTIFVKNHSEIFYGLYGFKIFSQECKVKFRDFCYHVYFRIWLAWSYQDLRADHYQNTSYVYMLTRSSFIADMVSPQSWSRNDIYNSKAVYTAEKNGFGPVKKMVRTSHFSPCKLYVSCVLGWVRTFVFGGFWAIDVYGPETWKSSGPYQFSSFLRQLMK